MTRKQLLSLALFTLVLLFIGSLDAHAQSQCTLRLADLPQSPELLGFRLGMTIDQVKVRVPQIAFGRSDDLGVSKTTINPDFDARFDKSTFPGVRSVSLDFLDAKLTSLWFGFDSTFKWKTVDEFVKGVSQSLQLPDAWRTWKIRGQQLRCADFSMTVSIIAEGPSFRLIDDAADNLLAARREAKEAATSESAEADETTEPDTSVPEILADSKSKTYFSANCLPLNPIDQKNRIVFKSTEEAEKAGYKRNKSCQD